MPKQLQLLFNKFDALNERERISVMLLTVVALIIFFIELIISPLNQTSDIASKQVTTLSTQIKQFESQMLVFKTKKNRDPDFQNKQKIKLLDEQIANINNKLKEKMRGLIEPKQMAKALEVVLTQNIDLRLLRVQSLGATPLSPQKAKNGKAPQELGVYQHGLQIAFEGTYLSTLKYLKALDDLPWNFYWDVLELKVEKYPLTKVVITVHTLSFHEGWIGV